MPDIFRWEYGVKSVTMMVMGMLSRPYKAARRRVVDVMTKLLTQPLPAYQQRVPNNLANLKEHLRVGDVVLIEGDQRISQVIRYLTQSSWSHSSLYIGNELRRFRPDLAEALVAAYGEEARYLLIEAEAGDGVVCAPIKKYTRHNLRVCRPHGLRRDHLERILTEVIGQLGQRYNVRHIFDLGRYFFPVTLIPRRFRRTVLHYGGDTTRRVICSTMLARAFAHVGFPILPRVIIDAEARSISWLRRLVGRNGHGPRALYRAEDPWLITPRDFDLSPYFDIVKFNCLASGKFDYRYIEWAGDGNPAPAPPTAPALSVPVLRSRSRTLPA